MIDGIPQEFMDELVKAGGSTGHLKPLIHMAAALRWDFMTEKNINMLQKKWLCRQGLIFFIILCAGSCKGWK